MSLPATPVRTKRARSCLGCLGRLVVNLVLLLMLAAAGGLLSFLIFPPFHDAPVAQVLLVGMDQPEKAGAPRRSDTIILCAAHLDGRGATLLSVPRDARVRLPHHRRYDKINAAFAYGRQKLLMETLADPDILNAQLPYYLIIDSSTTSAVIDALGGVNVDVPQEMNYDDNWADLHIHLKAGRQHLTGKQAVGYLRWRKNNHGGGNSTDIERTARQRELLIGIAQAIKSWHGFLRLPAAYRAFRAHSTSNLTLRQLVLLGWAMQKTQSAVVPGTMRTIRGISYVLCDWERGREIWANAVK